VKGVCLEGCGGGGWVGEEMGGWVDGCVEG